MQTYSMQKKHSKTSNSRKTATIRLYNIYITFLVKKHLDKLSYKKAKTMKQYDIENQTEITMKLGYHPSRKSKIKLDELIFFA